MSGPIPRAVADAAAGHAYAAQAAAFGMSARELAVLESRAKLKDIADARARTGQLTAPENWWANAPRRIRVVLLNLGAKTEGDNFARAALPWAAFSPADQVSVAAVAAELLRGLNGADCLGW